MNGPSSSSYYHLTRGPEIVVTEGSPPFNPDDPLSGRGERGSFLRASSDESTMENFGDDDEEFNFEDEEDLSHGSVAAINRYGTYESLERIDECEDGLGGLPDFARSLPRSKARFTFEEEDEEEEDLFEEDFESDFNFRFPTQIQDNTYSECLWFRLRV
jgi:hypothetical protein